MVPRMAKQAGRDGQCSPGLFNCQVVEVVVPRTMELSSWGG